ncbi:NAD(P)-dependent oxidoreductase [Roseovarius indicus]|uniref:NAD(P)-dependent oxidoreductase n=1 Tax=Roseovarius indicus TaxID=540747 RepID=UPI0032F03F71
MSLKLGFVGIGRMGKPMAGHLLDAGYDLTVFDPNKSAVEALVAKGAKAAESPKAVGDEAELILMSLPTPDVVTEAATGAEGISKGSKARAVIDLSTTGPTAARALAEGLKADGLGCVDSPVSGGVAGAEKGTLTLMTACTDELFAEVEPILKLFGKVTHVGQEAGQAQLIKVINNLMSVTALAIASEGIVLAEKAGVSGETLMNVVNQGSGRSNASEDKIPKYVLSRKFDFGFALGLSAKDVRLCIAESEALGVPMIVGSAAKMLMGIAHTQQGPDADLTELIKSVERLANVEQAS